MESNLKRRTGEIIKKSQIKRNSDGFEHISGYFQTIVNSNDFPSSAKKYSEVPVNSPFLMQQLRNRNKSKAKRHKFFSGLSISPIGSKKKKKNKRVRSECFRMSNSGEDNFIEDFVDLIGSKKNNKHVNLNLNNNTINLDQPEKDIFGTYEKTSLANESSCLSSKKSKFLKSAFMKSLYKDRKYKSSEKENYDNLNKNKWGGNINNSLEESTNKEILRAEKNSSKNGLKKSNEIFKNLEKNHIKLDLTNVDKKFEELITSYDHLYNMEDEMYYENELINEKKISKKNIKKDDSNIKNSYNSEISNNSNEKSFSENKIKNTSNIYNNSNDIENTFNDNNLNNSKNYFNNNSVTKNNKNSNSNQKNIGYISNNSENSIRNLKLKKKKKRKSKSKTDTNFFVNIDNDINYRYKNVKVKKTKDIAGRWGLRNRYPRIFPFFNEKVTIKDDKIELKLIDFNNIFGNLRIERKNVKKIKPSPETVEFGDFSADIVQRSKNKVKYKMKLEKKDKKILSYTSNKLKFYLYKLHKKINLVIKYGQSKKKLKKKILKPGEKFLVEKDQYYSIENKSDKELILSLEVFNNN